VPIRTNRGRAAVYRRLWSWPLRSPRHLIVFGIVLVVLGVIAATLIPLGSSQQTGSAGSAGSTSAGVPGDGSATGSSGTEETRLTAPLSTPTPAPPDPQALEVAVSFTRAWANHPSGVTGEQWLNGLKPYTTDEYLPQLSSVNVDNIPATKVTGAAVSVDSTTSSVVADVPTDGGTLRVTVEKTPNQGWRVSHFDKAT